tara:strand:- start:7730 stop:9994 length:2265 start_codon:yes stop_codon:yes gene_type:complete
MPRILVPLTNFQFGEVSPSLISRTDTKVYPNSAKTVTNFLLRNEGGLVKRFGSKRIYEFDTTYDSTKTQQHRLVPFIFSDDERYIISLENAKIRCFKIDPSTGAITLVETITADVDTNAVPFSDSILQELNFAQSGDIMFITHQTFKMRKLVRTGLNNFQLEVFAFEGSADGFRTNQPYYSFQSVGVTLDPSKTSGTGATLTTSSAYFDTTGSQSGGNYPNSKHIGVILRYHDNEIEIKSVQSATQATGDITDELTVHLDTNAIETTDGIADIEITFPLHGLTVGDSITIAHAGAVGGITSGQINGTRSVQEVRNENVIVVTAGSNANDSAIGGGTPKITTHAPTTAWGEQSYSELRGFPAAVTFHENRLWFGGTLGQPDGLWSSKISEYFNFDTGDGQDDEAISLTLSIGEINTVRHIISNRDLQVFTSTSEFYIPAFSEKPITPTNAQIKRQTPFGAEFVKPYSFDGATLYVQRHGDMIREFVYDDSEGAYVSNAVSTLSSHMITDVVQATVLRGAINRPESYALFLNSDGTIAVFTSNRAEQRAGWSKFTTDGKFHSICTIDERVFFVGAYDTGAGTTKFVLNEFDSSLNLDFANTFSGTAGVFDVSSHFANGATVDVINGTDYLGQFTVSGGNVDVSAVASITSAEIGYKFNVEAETLPIDAQVAGGPLTGNPRSVNRVILDLLDTLSVSVNNKELIIRTVLDDFSLDRTPVDGKKEFRLLGYSKDPTVKITQSAPLSLQVNGIIAEVTF